MTCREKLHIEHPGKFNEASGYITACPYTFDYAEEPADCPYRDRTKRADPTSQACQTCWNREIPENNEKQEVVVSIVDVKPITHAKWIYFRNEAGFKQCKCSECIVSYGCLDTPYCPNCGATMDLESEGTDE